VKEGLGVGVGLEVGTYVNVGLAVNPGTKAVHTLRSDVRRKAWKVQGEISTSWRGASAEIVLSQYT
jgi:hypothetical protein